ncbi:MAG: hypothetical protein EXS09_04045 [Gemmataceae bacterium]|nr:hypothetical protein [Gemmataceae bacterium]
MPNYFPCPNTQCTYQFDADILPPSAMVTCPLCRTRFPYRAQQSEMPAGAAPAADLRPSGPPVLNIREVPKGGGIVVTVLWVVGFCVVLGLVMAVVLNRGGTKFDNPTDAADQTFNIKVQPFPQPWESDAAAQKPVDGNVLGRKRSNPEAWIAIAARDFKDREPRTSELEEMMRTRLKDAFGSLEIEPIEGENWAGHSATAVRFTGNLEEAQMRGEAYVISHKGIGYIYFTWAAEGNWEAVKGEAPGLREKIKPAGFRDNWTAKRASVIPHDGGSFMLEDRDEAWSRGKPAEDGIKTKKTDYIVDDVKEFDPNATMAFRARYQRKERGDNLRKPAESLALVFELPASNNPLEAAKAYIVERIKKDYAGNAPDIKLEVMNRSTAGVPLPTGGPAIGRFLFQDPLSKADRTVYVISALAVGNKTVVVEAHAEEKDASYVEEWMVHLAGSLRAK